MAQSKKFLCVAGFLWIWNIIENTIGQLERRITLSNASTKYVQRHVIWIQYLAPCHLDTVFSAMSFGHSVQRHVIWKKRLAPCHLDSVTLALHQFCIAMLFFLRSLRCWGVNLVLQWLLLLQYCFFISICVFDRKKSSAKKFSYKSQKVKYQKVKGFQGRRPRGQTL